MKEIHCGSVECINNNDGKCKLKEISLASWNINTVNHGRKDMWECKQYTPSEAYGLIKKFLQSSWR